MSVSVLSTAVNAEPVPTTGSTPATLLPTVVVNLGSISVLQFLGHASGAYSDSGTHLKVLIDGVVVASQNAFGPLVAAVEVTAGQHNIDFEATSDFGDVNLANCGLVIMNLSA